MARFKFRRGEAVVHYSLLDHGGYWDRKAGARISVLATNLTCFR